MIPNKATKLRYELILSGRLQISLKNLLVCIAAVFFQHPSNTHNCALLNEGNALKLFAPVFLKTLLALLTKKEYILFARNLYLQNRSSVIVLEARPFWNYYRSSFFIVLDICKPFEGLPLWGIHSRCMEPNYLIYFVIIHSPINSLVI